MPIPESSPRYNDLIDAVTQSATKTIEIENKDGTKSIQQILDEDILWWKLLDVSNEKFGSLAYEVMELERQAQMAFNFMPKERAEQFAKDILGYAKSIRRSIDAKGSESIRDKRNSKSTTLDKIGHHKTEHIYTQKGEVKKGFMNAFAGKRDDDYDD